MIIRHQLCKAARPVCLPIAIRRWTSSASLAQRLSEPVQSYISTSRDPYLNLSIEHHLLQKSPPESAILFLYVNRPSIIIGRNQNPWLEVDLSLTTYCQGLLSPKSGIFWHIDLVRRRSGGGTVFHDEGNVNWTVICPSAEFTRDKHAEMVVRALRGCGVERARVNERHDIVLDQGERKANSDPEDTHATPYTDVSASTARPLKVSGSAYKLSRGRALHHGTALLSSPNLKFISQCLRSPAKPYITARGVESVSSPVTNINLTNERFITAIQSQFSAMYGSTQAIQVDEDLLSIPDIETGYDELQSSEWTYNQTPQFTLSNSSESTRLVNIDLTARHGVITEASITPLAETPAETPLADTPMLELSALNERFTGMTLLDLSNWAGGRLSSPQDALYMEDEVVHVVEWLQKMLPMVRGSL